MQIHNFEQYTPEWWEIRKLKGTGSKATAIKSCGKGLDTLARELVIEANVPSEEEIYSNTHTERGNELEEHARSIYEMETGNEVEEVGFIEQSKHAGASPDGLVGKDGGIEIKCVNDKKYFDYLIDGFTIESGHENQMQFCMWVSKRKWWDYVVYNPNFPKSILIKRLKADKEVFKQFEEGIKTLEELITKYQKVYESK